MFKEESKYQNNVIIHLNQKIQKAKLKQKFKSKKIEAKRIKVLQPCIKNQFEDFFCKKLLYYLL
jgi:hypothetical protein